MTRPETSSERPYLVVLDSDHDVVWHPIRGREATIGRDPSNDIQIAHPLVSKFHAKLLVSNKSVTVVDLASVNKTRVNGEIVTQATVRYGDEIQFARVRCRLELSRERGRGRMEELRA